MYFLPKLVEFERSFVVTWQRQAKQRRGSVGCVNVPKALKCMPHHFRPFVNKFRIFSLGETFMNKAMAWTWWSRHLRTLGTSVYRMTYPRGLDSLAFCLLTKSPSLTFSSIFLQNGCHFAYTQEWYLHMKITMTKTTLIDRNINSFTSMKWTFFPYAPDSWY